MAIFTYTATSDGDGPVSGTISADTPRQARDLLRGRGLSVQSMTDRAPSRTRGLRRRSSGGYRTVLFIRELSTLLAVGVPLLEALETIARQHSGRFLTTVLLLRDRVQAGVSLADAMREQPDVFDDMCINMVETGEDAGTLETSLERLAEFRERAQQLKGRISTALIYPAIIAVVAVTVMLFLMTFVVPNIIQPMIENGQQLPSITLAIKATSDFGLRWWWLLMLACAAAAAVLSTALQTRRGRWAWHGWLLKLPLLGELIIKQSIVRIAVVMATLLKSGIVFDRALQIAQRATRNLVIRDALARCEKAINAGGDIGASLAESRVFPPLVIQVFTVGQASGRLEEMLDRLSADYDAQVSLSAQRAAAILEPALIILLAVLVLFIILATVLPILEAGNVLG